MKKDHSSLESGDTHSLPPSTHELGSGKATTPQTESPSDGKTGHTVSCEGGVCRCYRYLCSLCSHPRFPWILAGILAIALIASLAHNGHDTHREFGRYRGHSIHHEYRDDMRRMMDDYRDMMDYHMQEMADRNNDLLPRLIEAPAPTLPIEVKNSQPSIGATSYTLNSDGSTVSGTWSGSPEYGAQLRNNLIHMGITVIGDEKSFSFTGSASQMKNIVNILR